MSNKHLVIQNPNLDIYVFQTRPCLEGRPQHQEDGSAGGGRTDRQLAEMELQNVSLKGIGIAVIHTK